MGEISVKNLYPALCWAYVRGQTSQLAALTSCDAGCSGTTVIISWFHMIFILSSRICASASPVTLWHISTRIIMRNALWISLVDYLRETQVPKPTNYININYVILQIIIFSNNESDWTTNVTVVMHNFIRTLHTTFTLNLPCCFVLLLVIYFKSKFNLSFLL